MVEPVFKACERFPQAPKIQLLIEDLNARCELLGSTELPMELKSHLQKWGKGMAVSANAHGKRLHKLAGERSLGRMEALVERRARQLGVYKE